MNQPTDTEIFDWMESHPVFTMNALSIWWAMAGRGFREKHFAFRTVIIEEMQKHDTPNAA